MKKSDKIIPEGLILPNEPIPFFSVTPYHLHPRWQRLRDLIARVEAKRKRN